MSHITAAELALCCLHLLYHIKTCAYQAYVRQLQLELHSVSHNTLHCSLLQVTRDQEYSWTSKSCNVVAWRLNMKPSRFMFA